VSSNQAIDTIGNSAVWWMFAILALCLWMLVDAKAKEVSKALVLIAGFLLVSPLLDWVMEFESSHFGLKFDYYLFHIDDCLGITAFTVARWFDEPQRVALLKLYESLTMAMVGWYAWHLRKRDGMPALLLTVYIIMYALAPVLYTIVPGRGPRHAFPGYFPNGHPEVGITLVHLAGWPNAMPSLHVSTALVLVLFAGRNKFGRLFAWTYLTGTIAATLALEHYMIDLIVALPFTCFAVTLAERRWRAAAWFFPGLMAWLLGIRFCTALLVAHPYLVRSFAVLTVVLCGFQMRRIPFLGSTAASEPPRVAPICDPVSSQPGWL
jgi:hypothetical protein